MSLMVGAVLPTESLPEGMSLIKEWSWRGGMARDYELSGDPGIGAHVGYYENGKLRFYYPISDGKYTGVCKTWYPNEAVESEAFFHDGIQEGVSREWYPTGALKSSKEFKKGRPHGSCREWYENGALKTESSYLKGRQDGVRKEWDDQGRLRTQKTYRAGFLNGISKKWYENGVLECVRHYEEELWHGPRIEWYPDGKMRYEGHYRRGQLHGMMKEYDQEGKLTNKGFFVAGISVGLGLTKVIEEGALNAGHILRARNAAIRRACLEVLGYARFLSQVVHKVIAREGDSELVRIEWHKREEPIWLVKVKCPSTGAYYALRVPPGTKTIKEALAWTFETKEFDYNLLEES